MINNNINKKFSDFENNILDSSNLNVSNILDSSNLNVSNILDSSNLNVSNILDSNNLNINNILDSNNSSVNNIYEASNKKIDLLCDLASKDDCSNEDRKAYIKDIDNTIEDMCAKDTENKKFLKGVLFAGCAVVATVGGIAIACSSKRDDNLLISDTSDDIIDINELDDLYKL